MVTEATVHTVKICQCCRTVIWYCPICGYKSVNNSKFVVANTIRSHMWYAHKKKDNTQEEDL